MQTVCKWRDYRQSQPLHCLFIKSQFKWQHSLTTFQSFQLMEKTAERKTKLHKHCFVDPGKCHYIGSGCHVKTINNHNLNLLSAMDQQ